MELLWFFWRGLEEQRLGIGYLWLPPVRGLLAAVTSASPAREERRRAAPLSCSSRLSAICQKLLILQCVAQPLSIGDGGDVFDWRGETPPPGMGNCLTRWQKGPSLTLSIPLLSLNPH